VSDPPRRRRLGRWWSVIALLVLVALWVVFAGRFLVVVDEPARADVVVVPSGDVLGNRLVAGARTLLETGSGRLVVFVQEGVYSEQRAAEDFLDREGVAPEIVRLVPPGSSTAEEAGTFAALAHRCGWRSAIVVTSPFHTRRAGWLFGRALGFPSVVRVVGSGEAFEAETWWSDDQATEVVLIEWLKLLASARYLVDRPDAPDPDVAC
jgi:uncharacterized SAM-binding protein YcdF (DUF218 family)